MKLNKKDKKKWCKNILKTDKIEKINRKARDIFSEFLELPREAISNSTKITTIDNKNILIEGYKQIEDYYDNYIKIKAYNMSLIIDGKDLDIKEITDTDLVIQGNIFSLNYRGG